MAAARGCLCLHEHSSSRPCWATATAAMVVELCRRYQHQHQHRPRPRTPNSPVVAFSAALATDRPLWGLATAIAVPCYRSVTAPRYHAGASALTLPQAARSCPMNVAVVAFSVACWASPATIPAPHGRKHLSLLTGYYCSNGILRWLLRHTRRSSDSPRRTSGCSPAILGGN